MKLKKVSHLASGIQVQKVFCHFAPWSDHPGEGGGLPFEMDGDARCLA